MRSGALAPGVDRDHPRSSSTEIRPQRNRAICVTGGNAPVSPALAHPWSEISVIPVMADAPVLHRKTSG
jgi:hypothetical protein